MTQRAVDSAKAHARRFEPDPPMKPPPPIQTLTGDACARERPDVEGETIL
jgi:hypothetical protein